MYCFYLFNISIASSVAVSSWTLVAISVERYYAICHPLSSRRWQTLSHAYKLIVLIWLGSLLFMLPIAYLSKLIPTRYGKSIIVGIVKKGLNENETKKKLTRKLNGFIECMYFVTKTDSKN